MTSVKKDETTMTTPKRPRSFFSISTQAAAESALSLGKKALACSLAYLMIPLGMGDLYAQEAPPPPPDQGQYQDQAPPPPDQGQQQYGDQDQGPPPQAYNPLPPDQMDQLVAPIALYPDSLVAQILAASTYPDQVADADHFLQANQGLPPDQLGQMVNGMNWDPSVKALIAFPSVLANLDRNANWTAQLGNAYYNQPQDVMSAVQDMRQRAYAAGNLRSGSQIAVQYEPGNIVIAPANPTVVYVPWYNPWVVYGGPIAPWGGFYVAPRPVGLYLAAGIALGFGVGIAIGTWNHWGWGWHSWGMGWHDRTVVYQRNVYISNSVRVVNHGYYGHFDRNPAARQANFANARRAPDYHPGNFNRTGSFNRPGNNNFNRPGNNARPGNNNFNRPNNNVRPAYNNTYRTNNQPNNNRPGTQPNNNSNRPAQNYSRPTTQPSNNYNRPSNNVSRPAQNYSRPTTQPSNNSRPAQNYSRPQAQQSRPQTQSRPQPQARPQGHTESRPAPKSNEKEKEHR
jgi:Protein of unknown function (DUF3300)